MDNTEIAKILNEIASLLELKGENTYKTRAYSTAARQIEGLGTPLKTLIQQNKLDEVKGIGKSIATKLTTLVETGKLPYYEELKSSFPPGFLEILRVPFLGPKKTKVLWEKLQIKSLQELEDACKKNKLLSIPGFGQKTQDKILEGINFISQHSGRVLLSDALPPAKELHAYMEKCPAVQRVSIAGSLRRWRETIKDIDLVASSSRPGEVMQYFIKHPLVKEVLLSGMTKTSVVLTNNLNVDLRVVADDEFPYALHYLTGSKDHNIAIRTLAQKIGYKVSEWGIFKGEKRIDVKDEE